MGAMSLHDPKAYRCCCGCVHVKPGTIVYGLFCLIIDLFGLAVLVLISIHPDILMPQCQKEGLEMDKMFDDDQKWARFARLEQRCLTPEDLRIGYIFSVVSIFASLALLFGVIKSRPGYMMPFVCIQVLAFCLCALTLLTFCAYASHADMQRYLDSSSLGKLSGTEEKSMMTLSRDTVVVFVVAFMVAMLIIRAYLLCMVWSCYKYIQQLVIARSAPCQYQVDPDSELLLPPKYEDAIKPQAYPEPPPYTQ